MNSKIKYSSIFLLLISLLILASGIAAAADIDGDNTEISDNIETPTVGDDAVGTPQTTDNNKESQTINEVDETYTDTTTTSESNKLAKEDKNLKGIDMSCTLTLTPNTAEVGSTINAAMTRGIFRSGTSYSYTLYIDNVVTYTGSVVASSSSAASLTFVVPSTINTGAHTVKIVVPYMSSVNNVCTATLTVTNRAIDTQIAEVETITGEVGNTIIPITITDTNGNAITGTPKINVKDGDAALIENYPIENGVGQVSVPTTRTGDYNLTVEVIKDSDFNPSTGTIPVSVSKAATTLTVDQYDDILYEIINVYENTVLTGTLVQTSNNNPIKNAQLTVTVDGTDYIITTDDEGKFTYKHSVDQIGDSIPISIVFNGDDLYLASQEISGEFEIEALEVNIALDEDPLSEVNETTTISGTITDNYNHQIPNAEVNLEITGVEDTVTVTTNDEGKFSYDVTYDDVLEVIVTASMKNQEIYEAETATMTFNVVVGPKRNHLTIETGNGVGTNINIVDVTPYFDETITNGTLIDIFGEPVADATIKILINGEDYSQTTDSEGKFTLVYNATEGLTTYTLSVEFEGNDAYKPAEEAYTGTFKTEAFDINVTIDENFPEEILIGDEITITGSATLQNNTLKNNPIVLTIDGTKYTTSTDEEGKYSYTYTVARNGTIPVIANATFANAAVTLGQTSFFVAKPVVNIDLDEIEDGKIYSDVTLNGRIYIAQNDTPIEDQLILKINGESFDLASDEDGTFTYTFTLAESGVYNILISYGNVKYNVQNATANVNSLKLSTQLINDKLPIAAIVNDVFAISGSLVDEYDNPIADAEVTFLINREVFTNITDSNGRYTYNYPTTNISENNLYEVQYAGDDTYQKAKNYAGSFFDIETTTAYVTIEASEVPMNTPTRITGTVTDKYDKLLSDINLTVTVRNEVIDVTTNDKGEFVTTYILPKVGTYDITATVTDNRYTKTTATTEATVTKLQTATGIKTVKVTDDNQANLTATVVDSNKKALTSGKVVFKIDGKTVKDESGKVIYIKIADGQAVLPYTFTQEQIDKNVSIIAAFSGSTNYDASQSQKTYITTEDEHVITMTLNDITSKAGETITITATVKDNDENVNTGKVVFKINGKTLKDDNGKVVYINVEDGVATYDYTLPETTKARNYTLSAVFTASNYNRTEANSLLTVENTTEDNGTDTPATVHVITNSNIDQYLTKNGLSSLVSPGDTLDIQGLIDKQNSLVINKPINIISSTKDAVINLHTKAGSLFGEDPGNCFTVNKAGAGSNISGLYLTNTECWIFNTHDVTLHNMTMYVKDAQVGSGVGQTAIRYCERITIDSCYIYTENNGGSTSMALTGTSHSIIKNTTIEGRNGAGQVGNILYLGNRYNTNDQPSDFTLGTDTNITIIDSTLKGECTAAITVLTCLGTVTNVTYINNTLNTSGNYGYLDTGTNGVAIGNKFYSSSGLVVRSGATPKDNIFYGTGTLTAYANTVIANSTINKITVAGVNVLIENNTIATVDMAASQAAYMPNNTVISNNIITGSITSTGPSRTRLNNNITIINNQIAGGITLSYTSAHRIENNTINGTVSITTNAGNTIIRYNTIVTSNQYAITIANTTTTVTNNYLVSNNGRLLGDAAVSGRATIANNTPNSLSNTHITFDEITGTIGDTIDIVIHVEDENGGNTDGTIYLLINDEILKDENDETVTLTVENNMAILENVEIPTEWLKSGTTITAVYTNGEYKLNESTTPNINKRVATVEITTEDLTVSAGDTITLTAKVTENEELINGQLAFKVNGASLEDENEELIYVDVVDGIATLEYTFADNMPTGTYTLTAVFENANYARSVDETTLIIE